MRQQLSLADSSSLLMFYIFFIQNFPAFAKHFLSHRKWLGVTGWGNPALAVFVSVPCLLPSSVAVSSSSSILDCTAFLSRVGTCCALWPHFTGWGMTTKQVKLLLLPRHFFGWKLHPSLNLHKSQDMIFFIVSGEILLFPVKDGVGDLSEV